MGSHFAKTEVAEQMINELREDFNGRLEALKNGLSGKKLYIVGMKRDINWLLEAATGCGMDVVRCVVMDMTDRSELKDVEKEYNIEMIPGGRLDRIKYAKDRTERILDPYIPVDPDTEAWIKDDVNEKVPDLILTTYPVNTRIRTCFLPVNPNTSPFEGTDFATSWMRVLKTPITEGWRKDVV
jgi:hypothetical protein